MHAKKLISACTNSASGTHRALVGARSKCHLHIEQPAGLAQHADTPSAQVQTLRASRSMRACCGGALTREGPARTPIAPPRGRGDGYAPTPRAHGSRFACVRDLAQHADTPSVQVQARRPLICGTQAKRGPCDRGVCAYPSPRPRGGAIGVRACPTRVSAPHRNRHACQARAC